LSADKLLLVEDDDSLRRVLRTSLSSEGYQIVEARGVTEAMSVARSHNPDLVLLDLGLADGDGLGFLQEYRKWSRRPVVVLSARRREVEKVRALDAGADDYVSKPFGTQELAARLRAALRRSPSRETAGSSVVESPGLRIDLELRKVAADGVEVHLTDIEWRILEVLARKAGRICTHEQILREVWGPGHTHLVHYVRIYMRSLRHKLETEPARPVRILTETGVGYRLAVEIGNDGETGNSDQVP
jgi:two-component system KDP operon response regulator KdpE